MALPLVFLSLLLLLSACVTTVTPQVEIESRALLEERHIQRTIALQQNIKDNERIQNVSFPLQQASAPFCEREVRQSLGLDVATGFDFDESFQRSAREVLGASGSVSVITVFLGGPAAKAGLRSQDIILAVNENPLITGQNATAVYENLLEEEMQNTSSIQFKVQRGAETLDFELTPVTICDYPVSVIPGNELNAFADGDEVFVTRAMLRFIDNDRELALVVAHELAHNIMNHIAKRRANSSLGNLVDLAARTQGWDTGGYFGELAGNIYSHAFEAEADYVGMYILARTGMDLDGATYFWRRMAVESPANIDSHSISHPATAERFLALEQALQEINEKKAAGVPLNPELK